MMTVDDVTSSDLSDVYQALGKILTYPDAEFLANLDLARELVHRTRPEEIVFFDTFAAEVSKLTPEALEELYVATFDVQAACCLDVGYAMFGEDYKRGQCMAELKVLHRTHGVDCGTELPDFLPNVLKLLPKLSYGDAAELVREIVSPGAEKMLASLETGALENQSSRKSEIQTDTDYCTTHESAHANVFRDLSETGNPYRNILLLACGVLKRDYLA